MQKQQQAIVIGIAMEVMVVALMTTCAIFAVIVFIVSLLKFALCSTNNTCSQSSSPCSFAVVQQLEVEVQVQTYKCNGSLCGCAVPASPGKQAVWQDRAQRTGSASPKQKKSANANAG